MNFEEKAKQLLETVIDWNEVDKVTITKEYIQFNTKDGLIQVIPKVSRYNM